MWLLITFITIWAIFPGPVVIMTVHETRKRGAMAGVLVAAGASLTAVFMVIAALLIHSTGYTEIADSALMVFVERAGAVGIILLGLYTGYRCLSNAHTDKVAVTHKPTKAGFVQGMGVMATGTPEALLFYTVIVPQTVAETALISSLVALGALKVIMIFGFHAVVALMAARSTAAVRNVRFKKVLEFGMSLLLVLMGANVLI